MTVQRYKKLDGRSRGFTLIELMVVTVIVGILLVIAYPSYQDQIVKSRRDAAEGELVQLVSIQEKIYLNDSGYTASVSTPYTGHTTGGLGKTGVNGNPAGTTDDGRYNIILTPVGAAPFQAYTLTATPVAGGSQAADGDIIIAADGTRTRGGKPW